MATHPCLHCTQLRPLSPLHAANRLQEGRSVLPGPVCPVSYTLPSHPLQWASTCACPHALSHTMCCLDDLPMLTPGPSQLKFPHQLMLHAGVHTLWVVFMSQPPALPTLCAAVPCSLFPSPAVPCPSICQTFSRYQQVSVRPKMSSSVNLKTKQKKGKPPLGAQTSSSV